MIGFLSVEWLYLAAIIPFVCFGGFAAFRSIEKLSYSLSGFRASGSTAIVAAALLCVPLLVGLIGVARPYSSHEVVEVPVSGSEIMFVLDISQSMLAKDIAPSRIVLAKRKMVDLISLLRASGASHRFGITLFAGAAYLYCPLTSDTVVLRQFIDSISPGLVTSKGSDIGSGLTVAIERLRAVKAKSPRIVILSDGEESSEALTKATELARNAAIPVDALGIGTAEGSPIEIRAGLYLRDSRGETVISKLREQELRDLTDAAGGQYLRAEMLDSDVKTLARETQTKFAGGSEVTSKIDIYGELGPWCAAIAAFFALGIFGAPNSRLRSISIVIAFGMITAQNSITIPVAVAQEDSSLVTSLPQSNDPEKGRSIDDYNKALSRDPDNRALQEGLAAALFRAGKAKEAAQLYKKLSDSATKGFEYFENRYNEGTSHLAAKRYDEAIAALKDALRSKPDDPQTTHNLGVAERLKVEEEKRQEEQKQQEKSQDQDSQQPEKGEREKDGQSNDSEEKHDDIKEDQSSSSPTGQQQNAEQREGEKQGSSDDGNGAPDKEAGELSKSRPESSGPDSERPKEAEISPDESQNGNPSSEEQQNQSADKPDTVSTPSDLQRSGGKQGDRSSSPQAGPSVENSDGQFEKSEAEVWLDSLPDSPLLLRRHGGSGVKGGQTW